MSTLVTTPTIVTVTTPGDVVSTLVIPPTIVTVAAPGPQGPSGTPGPPGAPGGGSYRHDQITPSAVVTVPHNLGRHPAGVSVCSLDLAVSYSEYVVQHLDLNTVRVSMDTPTACSVLLI